MAISQSFSDGYAGIFNTAQFALLNPASYTLQRIGVDNGDGTARMYMSDGVVFKLMSGLTAAQSASVTSLVSVGAGRLRRGTYGRKVASWGSLQNSTGTVSLVANDLPSFNDGSVNVLRVDQNAAQSFGQQNPVDGSQAYMPLGKNPGFSAGLWVKNPSARTLSFQLTFFNPAANHTMAWNGSCESGGWRFITFSPSQLINGAWILGTDAVSYCRLAQYDAGTEGSWVAGEYLLFGNVYVDCAARPRFLLTFDDGLAVQSRNNPGTINIVSGSAFVSSTTTNVLTTAAAHGLIVGEPHIFTETPPTSLSAGTIYYVQTVPTTTTYTLATDAALVNTAITTGFVGTARWQYGGSQARTLQDLVESYGFRGSLFLVPKWLGTSGKYGIGNGFAYMSAADALKMVKNGWAVGSHSSTHPFNLENAGLRLLGPYGYYLSNTFDNLSANYLSQYNITAGNGRRRATSATLASPTVVTFEALHQFSQNQPIVWSDVAPTGMVVGEIYYVASVPTGNTATFAIDQGTLVTKVNNTTGAWFGTANYRHPGSAPDDSVIYSDIMEGINGLVAIGINTGNTFFALPQGAADSYVRSACIRSGIKWVRGVSGYNNAHTIPIGKPSGGGLSLVGNIPGGWMEQVDAVQTDGANTLAQIDTYLGDTIIQGACGCCYHHGWAPGSLKQLDRLCQSLRTKSDAGLIDVMTLDQYGVELEL